MNNIHVSIRNPLFFWSQRKCVCLFAAGVLLGFGGGSSSIQAETILRRGWQLISASAGAAEGSHRFASHERRGYPGIPGSRDLMVDAFLPAIDGLPETHATTRAAQSATIDGNSIVFHGNLSAQQSGVFPSAYPDIFTFVDFEITDQPETFTLDLLTEVIGNYHSAYNPGGMYVGLANSENTAFLCCSVGGYGSTLPQSYSNILPPGNYSLSTRRVLVNNSYEDANHSLDYSHSFSFTNLSFAPGWSQDRPLLPDSEFQFTNVPSRTWFDPVPANQFDFQMTSESLFTQIMSFPTGFSEPFEVVVENTSLGFFGVDDSVDFVSLLGHGVPAFSVRNIVPTVDGEDPTAFPILLNFDTPTASFTMTPVFVPEPSSVVITIVFAWLGTVKARKWPK